MELRRALLLFAIVLGVAAVVAALANPSSRRSETTTTDRPVAKPSPDRPGREPARVRIRGGGAAARETVTVGQATTVVVSVDEPGQVELEGLGLTEAAEPRDPAVFETLPARRARHRVLFTPSGAVRSRVLGELVSQPAK